MGFSARVILDSLAPCGKRLATVEATYPRFIHCEVLTHRDRARNSASSRAIPWPAMMARIEADAVLPIRWGSEQKGMQTGGEIDCPEEATRIWLQARDQAVASAKALAALGVHKSLCNRLTEPWMWITVIMTATEWKNFFRLRCHPDAEIHFQQIAGMIRDALEASKPNPLSAGEWHLPLVAGYDLPELKDAGYCLNAIKKISTARCARVSYLTHDGKRAPSKDIELFDRLSNGSGFGHWSPMEHVAEALAAPERSGPFAGWRQYRKEFPLENEPG